MGGAGRGDRTATGSWYATVDSRETYDGRVRVRVDEVEAPNGDVLAREIVEAIDSVVVVALVDEDVVLVRQYRHATGGDLLELPAGILDVEGETHLEAAARELAEETGLGGGRLRALGTFWSSPGWTTQRFTVVLATGVRPVGTPDDFEPSGEERHMEVVRLPLTEAVAEIGGAIRDGATSLGLLAASRVLA